MSFERCRKCEKRLPACQDSCEYYKQEKERIAEKKSVIESNKKLNRERRNYIFEHYDKNRRKR